MGKVEALKVEQVAVPVADLERAKTFYGDVLGLPHLFDAPPGLAFFQCGETRLMLSRPEGPEAAGGAIVYYRVEDAAAACQALADTGTSVLEGAKRIARLGDQDVWLAILRDSEGNMIGLMSEQPVAA
jgi:methylmalonyl-CoA/ethylmalonyl-CoA epimerase